MKDPLFRISVVLVEPRQPGNVGAAARAMLNMGLTHLRLVRPCDPLSPEARAMAGRAVSLLQEARTFDTLREAVADQAYVVGTSRRRGKRREPTFHPREGAPHILAQAAGSPVALVFGPEERGLTAEELSLCQNLLLIPADERLPSLNLAQAVMVVAYELFLAAAATPPPKAPTLARSAELEALFDHMRESLLEVGFLDPQNPERVLGALRRMLGRAGLDPEEVRTLRGLFRQLSWYILRKKREGRDG
ncbi:MAG: RNA methyltransferase [Nitrospinota bacterium]